MGEAIKIRKRTYWTTETFKERMKELNPNIRILGEYVNSGSKIKCECLIDGNIWYPTPDSLLARKGCNKCAIRKNSEKLRMTQDEFMNDFYNKNKHANNIQVLGKYKNRHTRIECICKICGHNWYPYPSDLLDGYGCPKCSKRRKRNQEEFINDMNKINPNIEILGEFVDTYTEVEVMCKIDRYSWSPKANNLLNGYGCPVCANHVVIKGINDLGTTRPDLLKYFDNIEDAYSITSKSSKQQNLHCINCGNHRKMKASTLSDRGFYCPICSDKISYPNKFLRAFLYQLPVTNIIFEYSPEWIGNKKYDGYFEYKNQQYIIEMDGEWHYKDNEISGTTAKQVKEIDIFKENIAEEHGVTVIRIDSRKSNKDYISNNIFNSKLNNIFDLSIIDWDKCDEYCQKNIIKEVCDYYMNISKDTSIISKKFSIHAGTIRKYLRKGYSLGWCDYTHETNKYNAPREAIKKTSKKVNVYKDGTNIYSFSSIFETKRELEKELSIKIDRNKIVDCCNGKISQYKGFQFKFA